MNADNHFPHIGEMVETGVNAGKESEMGYNYQKERENVFTENGSVMFMKIRDNAKRLIQEAGAARYDKITEGCTGPSWTQLACVDRLVELGELIEVRNPTSGLTQRQFYTESSDD